MNAETALKTTNQAFEALKSVLSGDLFTDDTLRRLYATDASAYRELPAAVAIPKSEEDIRELILFASRHQMSLIPRAAGTSLAGQVVGSGIVVDISKYFNTILEVNQEESWVRVQPGVVRDDLNRHLKTFGLFFGPETSTANRAMIGGMVGNNSCGSNSIVYGSTRDHLLELKGFLSDGSAVELGPLSPKEFQDKLEGKTVQSALEQAIYQKAYDLLSQPENRKSIEEEFPKKSIPRRNTGYALDLLMNANCFDAEVEKPFNFCKLVAGSEGTLMMITEIKLHVDPLPPAEKALLCLHANSIDEALHANLIALNYQPHACELIDKFILDCTKSNLEHRKNRFFLQGDPAAILVIELAGDDRLAVEKQAHQLVADLKKAGYGYHYPILFGEDMGKIWALRKAGLGLLSNMPGDAKPAPVIEDTAVDVQELPAYIREFNASLKEKGLSCVHYAHAGSGELHLRPILNLKTEEGNRLFKAVATDIAALVKKYKGSLSGEHGDGRLRAEFIPFMIGEKNYQLLKDIKKAWDPNHVFNPGKIVNSPPMNSSLRYEPGQETPELETYFDFSETQGIIRAAEQCNGSGDCRKSHGSGGTMCPSYMATRNEKDTTRARANILREMMTKNGQGKAKNPFDHEPIKEVMDLCLSCKGCKSECPSNVDLAKLKAEFLQQYYDANGTPFRAKMIGHVNRLNRLASIWPGAYNFLTGSPLSAGLFKQILGFAPERPIPKMASQPLSRWFKSRQKRQNRNFHSKLYFFNDEFTNFLDVEIGKKAILLLEALGYEVIIPKHEESGRSYFSKGMVKAGRKVAMKNIAQLAPLVTAEMPLVGLEPSAILSLRDEYPDLARGEEKEKALILAEHSFTIEEFLAHEMDKGKISAAQFTTKSQKIRLHGHCHQKALSSLVPAKKILSLPKNYEVRLIPSGCCGMAGSFGYEKEHYAISMQIGELVLFPEVRKSAEDHVIAAPGTSCRHQIKDGTGHQALHPVEILYAALV